MMSTTTKDNIRENIARFVIEKGEEILSDYFDEENDEGTTENVAETKPLPMAKPFTTDIIPLAK